MKSITYYDFKNGNYQALNDFFASFDWDSLFNNINCDGVVALYYDILYTGIDLYIPLKKFKTTSFPIWFNSELKNTIYEKKSAHK